MTRNKKLKPAFFVISVSAFLLVVVTSTLATIGLSLFINGSYFLVLVG